MKFGFSQSRPLFFLVYNVVFRSESLSVIQNLAKSVGLIRFESITNTNKGKKPTGGGPADLIKPVYEEFERNGFGSDVRVIGIKGGDDFGIMIHLFMRNSKLLMIYLKLPLLIVQTKKIYQKIPSINS